MKRMLWGLTLLAAACGEEPRSERPEAAAAAAAPTMVVDSLRPVPEELSRFRQALGRSAPTGLEDAVASRDGLVQEFVRALETQDTARLVELSMNAAEFAWFYYPYTVYTHPPYTQAPGAVWLLTTQNGEKGLVRLVRRFGGTPIDYRGHRCERTEPQDLNVLHVGCVVLLGSDTVARRLFGTILERAGRFKFVSYANEF